jgi:general secretion pathway protein B
MSFILDALKKAESERNRRVAPVLMDARIAPPRRGLPGWALALGIVLLVNLGVVTWLLLRTPASDGTAATAAPPASAAPPAAASPAPATPAITAPSPAPLAPLPDMPANTAAVTPPPYVPPPADTDALPTLDELRYAGVSLPELQLNLHIYDPAPAHRSVLLNGQRLREGEYSPNGVKVESITPAGVVLEAGGRRFRLETGG